MPRISLREQYDNKDVIQQIYDLKDSIEDFEGIQTEVDTLSKQVDSYQNQIDQANATALQAVQQAQDAMSAVGSYDQQIQDAVDTAEQAEATAGNAYVDVSTVSSATAVTMQFQRGNSSTDSEAIPVASSTQAGIVNVSTYNGWMGLMDRVSALENARNTYYGAFSSDNPAQGEITSVFVTVAGRQPKAGDYLTDIARNLTYGYTGQAWVKVEASGEIPLFTQGTSGLIVGANADGKVYAEADGTGSVVGWDTVKAHINTYGSRVDTLTTQVGNSTDAGSATGSLYARSNYANAQITSLTSQVASKTQLTSGTYQVTAADWNNGTTATVSASVVTADNMVWVAPTGASWDDWTENGVRATAQGAGTITLECDTAPANSMTFNVIVG